MNDSVASIGTALQGPLGGMLAVLTVGAAVMRGQLRLGREVTSLEAQLAQERARGDKWEGIAMKLLTTTDRALNVADTAVSAGRTV